MPSAFGHDRRRVGTAPPAGAGRDPGTQARARSQVSTLQDGLAQATERDALREPPVQAGERVAHYRILAEIGRGGMGVVYRARDSTLGRDVALKCPWPALAREPAARQRFMHEAHSAARLAHPNIVPVFEVLEWKGIPWLAMELIEGRSLQSLLSERGALPLDMILRCAEGIAGALRAAHAKRILHRDLKPGNVLVTNESWPFLTDFGLACAFAAPDFQSSDTTLSGPASAQGHVAGTRCYMSPEQVLGQTLDGRSDVFSFGALVYEMCTGRLAFPATLPGAEHDAILHREPAALAAINREIPDELDRIIRKALAKRPDERYRGAGDLHADLVDLRRRVESLPAAAPSPMVPPARRALLVSAAIVALSGIAAGLWNEYDRRGSRPQAAVSIAVLPFADLSSEHDQEYFSDGLAEEILNDLAKIRSLRVVARTSAFQFKGRNEDLRVIGRTLNVDNVLEGSVRSSGTRVRITVQLVKTKDGFHLWSESYERDLRDILTVEDDIARAVTSALQVKLLPGGPATTPTLQVLPAAYQGFLEARYFARLGDRDSVERALGYANTAIQADTRYAAAYALRATLTLSAGGIGWTDYSEAVESARHDTERAIELDPNLADGYRVLSHIQSAVESSCPVAETTIRRARELGPGDAENLGASGLIAACLGHQEEAVGFVRQAIALDPLQPRLYLRLGQSLRDLGRHEEAQAALAKALELSPHHIWVHETRGEVYMAQGRLQEALEEMDKEPPSALRDLGLTLAFHALGRRKEADAALERLERRPSDCAYQIGQAYANRGEVDKAFEWLDRARKQHDGGLMSLRSDLLLRGLRGDPRYARLLDRLQSPSQRR